MWIIKYYNNEPKEFDKDNKPVENIVSLEYPVYTVEDRDKWYDIIKKTYEKYGEVTVEEGNITRPKSLEDIVKEQQEINKILIAQILKQNGVVANDWHSFQC